MLRGIRKTQPQATNKQTNEDENQTDVGTIHNFEQRTNAGGGGEGKGGGVLAAHTWTSWTFLKMDQYFAAAPAAKTLTCQLAAPVCPCKDNCVRHCYIFRLAPSPLCLRLSYVNIWPCYSSSACPRSVWKVNWIFHQRVDPTTSAATLKWQLATSPVTAHHPPSSLLLALLEN